MTQVTAVNMQKSKMTLTVGIKKRCHWGNQPEAFRLISVYLFRGRTDCPVRLTTPEEVEDHLRAKSSPYGSGVVLGLLDPSMKEGELSNFVSIKSEVAGSHPSLPCSLNIYRCCKLLSCFPLRESFMVFILELPSWKGAFLEAQWGELMLGVMLASRCD